MGLQAIDAAPKYGNPVFLVDQDTGDMNAAHWAVRRGVSFQRLGASFAFSPARWLWASKTIESSRGNSRVVARASVAVAVCVLWFFIGAVGDKGLCGESNTRAQAFVAPTDNGRKIAQSNTIRDDSLLASQVVATTVVEQKQIFERGAEKVDILAGPLTPIQRLDAAQGKVAQAPQSAPTWERKQSLEHEHEWDKAVALARALTSSLRGELDAVRSAAEAARSKQKQSLDQERGRADTLARELTALQAELDKARIVGLEAVQATEAEIKQKQALEQERGRADTLARELTALQAELDKARIVGMEAVQAREAEIKQKQALEQDRNRADTLARELASLRAELDAARVAGSQAVQAREAESKQKRALEQERSRADTLARELASLRAELDAARVAGSQAVQAREAESKQKQALEQELKQERASAEGLARELTSLRAEPNTAWTVGPEVAQAAAAEAEQKQALKRELEQERARAEVLTRELTSLRSDLDTARAAGLETVRTAEAAKIEQKLAFGKERDKTETLARELASARKEAEERSARLAGAHAEVLQVSETNRALAAEKKLALASERDRADALTRDLTSVRNELEASKKQIATLNTPLAVHSREPAVDSAQAPMAESSSRTIEGKGRSPEQISGEAVASTSGRSSVSELPRPEAPSAAREAASDLVPKVAAGTERSTSANAAPPSLVDEQRLLARANALLRQADISGARPLLQLALERGSARAAFMLAETYDARVLQSWRTSGISGDRTKARELYERAQAGGIEDAKERIETLNSGSARNSVGSR
jgi:hypothetical protein